jgi:hypothetical protein
MTQSRETPEENNSPRALLTEAERRALSGGEMDSNNRSTHIARVRQKIDRLGEDAQLLEETHPELYRKAQECFRPPLQERISQLETEVEDIKEQFNNREGNS